MMTYKEFELLKLLAGSAVGEDDIVQTVKRRIRYRAFHSDAEILCVYNALVTRGYIEDGHITESAITDIASCRVKQAVILAAGGAGGGAKASHSMPKGLFVKNGETLIERQIRQLKEAGIDDITVVVGYRQEMYFFLTQKYGVKIIVNPDTQQGNVYSLFLALKKMNEGNCYVCNCDNYFAENPFYSYEYNAFHATVKRYGRGKELFVSHNDSGRITGVHSGDETGECIYGHAYMDSIFASRIKQYMEEEMGDFRASSLFWEEFVSRHIENLDMYVREYDASFLYEFDSIQQIQNIDTLFLDNVSGKIRLSICDALGCAASDIKDINVLQKGLTNILFTFCVKGSMYIFRWPGDSSSFFIRRRNECRAQQLAAASGVDSTCVYIDEAGVKIAHFVEGCEDLSGVYYKDIEFMKSLARSIRRFHDASRGMADAADYDYDPIAECERYMSEASKVKGDLFAMFKDEWSEARELQRYADMDGMEKTMCHNDINQDNCLLKDGRLDIIDWEFAGWNDRAYDFGRVIAGYSFDDERIDKILAAYFDRPATERERLHWIAYMGIHNWYYFGWALYKESINESSRDWMYFFYNQAKRAFDYALPHYRSIVDRTRGGVN